MTLVEYETLLSFVECELSRFCQLGTGARPTREQLVYSIREVFPRMGWSMMRLGEPTEWGDYLLAALEMVEQGSALYDADIKPGDYLHRLIACCAVLGWADAPWALEPAPWKWAGLKWPGSPGAPLPSLSTPAYWRVSY